MSVSTPEEMRDRYERETTLPSGSVVRARKAGDRALFATGQLQAKFAEEVEALGAFTRTPKDGKQFSAEEMSEIRCLQDEATLRQHELLLNAILIEPRYAEVKEYLDDADATFLLREFGGLSAEEREGLNVFAQSDVPGLPPEEQSEMDFTSGGSECPPPQG